MEYFDQELAALPKALLFGASVGLFWYIYLRFIGKKIRQRIVEDESSKGTELHG